MNSTDEDEVRINMNYSRREEPFRYEFPEPLLGEFQVIKANGKEVESRPGIMKLMDISLHGAKICTDINFKTKSNKVELAIYFRILSTDFIIPGSLVYQVPRGAEYVYGVHLDTDNTTREQLTEELKALAWRLV